MKTFEPQEILSTYTVFLIYEREYISNYYTSLRNIFEFIRISKLEEGLLYIRNPLDSERYLGYYTEEEKLVYAYPIESMPNQKIIRQVMEYKKITGNFKDAIAVAVYLL